MQKQVFKNFRCVQAGLSAAVLIGLLSVATAAMAVSDGTALGNAVEGMQPGDWVELSTNNLDTTVGATGGASGHILTYADGGSWNPTTKELFFIGGDHNGGPQRFISYSAATNSWVIETRPFWMSGSDNQDHGYDYGGIDTANGEFYHAGTKYNIGSNTWEELSLADWPGFGRANNAFEFFPGVGYVVVGNGGVWVFDPGNNSWRTISDFNTWSYAGLHPIAEYIPTHNVLVFGGGDNTTQLFQMDAQENITALNASVSVSQLAVQSYGSITTHDPVSGNLLVVDLDSSFYQYDFGSDSWGQISSSLPHFQDGPNSETDIDNLIAIPMATYGVIMFVMSNATAGPDKVYLYKHAPFTPAPVEIPVVPAGESLTFN